MAVDHRGGLRRLFDGGTVVASSERQLLDRFLFARDELAFEAIVKRHGPMVVGVCRSVLKDEADIDDAFQATFLVLVKKAGSLRDADQLSPWLHGVARRVALEARTAASKRRGRESQAVFVEPAAPDPSLGNAEHRELRSLIHAELDRLSPPERSAILLCDLQGLSHQEAADQLGWPLGTVKARVARGRDRLRGRLIRRGVTLSSGLLASGLAAESSASILVSPTLIAATTRAALAVAAGRVLSVGLISAPVATLTQGAVRAMIVTKLKAVAVALAATTSVLAVPSLVAYQQTPKAEPAKSNQTAPVPLKNDTPQVVELTVGGSIKAANPSKLKLMMAQAAVKSIDEYLRNGQAVSEGICDLWYRRLADAEVEEATSKDDRVKAVESYVNRVRRMTAERSQKIESQFAENSLIKNPVNQAAEWNGRWNEALSVAQPLEEAKQWLARVRGESVDAMPKNGPVTGKLVGATSTPPSVVGGFGGGAFGGGGFEPPLGGTIRRQRLKTLPSDDEKNQAILAKLEERITMPFANETPLSDVIKYIEQSTIDEPAGFPVGIPIYVDPQELQDADKTMASTIAINLQGLPLRVSLHLLLKQLNLTYVVEGGLLIVATPMSDIYPSNQPNRTKPPTPPTPAGGGRQ